MATDLENLLARKKAICAELAAMNSSKAGGLPDSAQGGVRHLEYRMSLYRELTAINEGITAAEGPFEVMSRGV